MEVQRKQSPWLVLGIIVCIGVITIIANNVDKSEPALTVQQQFILEQLKLVERSDMIELENGSILMVISLTKNNDELELIGLPDPLNSAFMKVLPIEEWAKQVKAVYWYGNDSWQEVTWLYLNGESMPQE